MLGVFVDDGFAQVEGDEDGFDFFGVQTLDGGVVPVDFIEQVFHVVRDARAADVFRLFDLHQTVFADEVVFLDQHPRIGNQV